MLNLAYYILNWELHACVENFFSLFLKFQRDLFVLSYCTLKVLFILSLCYLQTFLCVLTIFLNLPLLNVYQQIAKIILNQFTVLLSWNSLDYFPYELPKESDRINLSNNKTVLSLQDTAKSASYLGLHLEIDNGNCVVCSSLIYEF